MYGSADPATWSYRTSVYGPSGTTTQLLPAEGVIHLRYLCDPARPWAGVAPLAAATIAGRLSAETATALADEVGGPRGSLLPLPVDGEDPTMAALKTDIRNLAGRVATVESVRTMEPGAPGSAPQDDWKPRRLGFAAPAAEIELLARAFVEVLSSCGVPPGLYGREDGAGQRESFRRFMHSSLEPIARLIAQELSEKFEAPIVINLDRIFAADLAGRARAFQSMVGGGMATDQAAALAGLLARDDGD